MSNYHPESWNPAWSVSTILTAFLSFFLGTQYTTIACFFREYDAQHMCVDPPLSDPADPATTGSILTTTEEKREHALA